MRTPSFGIDQNKDKKFVDKYWGRCPKYLHRIQETINLDPYIVECNPEFVLLVNGFIDGTIVEKNLSPELYAEVKQTVDLMIFYGLLPMPEHDPLFACMGMIPSSNSCPSYLCKNETGTGCEVYYDTDLSPYLVLGQPTPPVI
ncbi:MAG: hypothetical protein DRQ78_04925 [Epsilonproteobacteria bacterium]|nr:MAG: hypothetical protein DRQ78_04925 [Campylobacterota bacterium]